ncbi:MAG: hypothetical protein IJ693_11320 [Bacteroidaceae bacterium]|nr:hypothetical protein [Bacteroidaceae bacterium]
MKALRTLLTAVVLLGGAMTMNAQRMSIVAMQSNARFLTDRMAYTLGINDPFLIDEIYRINYDYIWGVNEYLDDVALGYYYDDYMAVCAARDAALRNLLGVSIWNRVVGYSYFYRPIVFANRGWHFSIYDYDRYGARHFFFSAPRPIARGYAGGHFFHGMAPRGGRMVAPAPGMVPRGGAPAPVAVPRGGVPAPNMRGGAPAPDMNNRGGYNGSYNNNVNRNANANRNMNTTPNMNRGGNMNGNVRSDNNNRNATPGMGNNMRSGSNMNSSSRQPTRTTSAPSFSNASMNTRTSAGATMNTRSSAGATMNRSGGATINRGGGATTNRGGGRR